MFGSFRRVAGRPNGVSMGDGHGATPPLYVLLISGIAFEIVWLLCVLNPGNGLVLGVTLANFLLHVVLCCAVVPAGVGGKTASVGFGAFLRCCTWIGLVVGAGVCLDAVLFRAGIFIPTPKSGNFAVIPVWLACLWVNFALALRFALVFLRRNLFVTAVVGAVGGPLSYFLGAAIGGLVALAEPLWLTLALLSLLWAAFLVGSMILARRPFLRY